MMLREFKHIVWNHEDNKWQDLVLNELIQTKFMSSHIIWFLLS